MKNLVFFVDGRFCGNENLNFVSHELERIGEDTRDS
jgi:hypothetical protein